MSGAVDRARSTDEESDVAMEEFAEEKKRTVPKEIKKKLPAQTFVQACPVFPPLG